MVNRDKGDGGDKKGMTYKKIQKGNPYGTKTDPAAVGG
jgi:hypothetical protein